MNRNIRLADLCRETFAGLRGNWFTAIGGTALFFVIEGFCCWLEAEFAPYERGNLFELLLLPLNFGIMSFFLRLMRGAGVRFRAIFEPFQNYFHYLWGGLRQSIFIALWSLLLLIPGIIASYRYAMTWFIMLDEPELSAKEAMTRSSQLMMGHKLQLFGYSLLLVPIFFIGTITVIGLIWVIPFCLAFLARFYLALKAAPEDFQI